MFLSIGNDYNLNGVSFQKGVVEMYSYVDITRCPWSDYLLHLLCNILRLAELCL